MLCSSKNNFRTTSFLSFSLCESFCFWCLFQKQMPNLMEDNRFSAMFVDTDYQVDEESEEFRLLNPLVSKLDRDRKKRQDKIKHRIEAKQVSTAKRSIIGEDLFGEIGELIHFAKINGHQNEKKYVTHPPTFFQ